MNIRSLTSLLPKVIPIHDLLLTTDRLRRADRIYNIANLVAVTALVVSLSYTFIVCVSVF